MDGLRRGLRRPVAVHTDWVLVKPVGRSGEPLADGSDGPSLAFGRLSWDELKARAIAVGGPLVAQLGGLPRRTVSEALTADGEPTEATLRGIAAGVAAATLRRCPVCGESYTGRSDKQTCSDRCRKRAKRQADRTRTAAIKSAAERLGMPRQADQAWVDGDPRWVEAAPRGHEHFEEAS